jgi:hypothetical protein
MIGMISIKPSSRRHPTEHPSSFNVRLLCCKNTARPHRRIQGRLSGTEHDGDMYADYLEEMSPAGDLIPIGMLPSITCRVPS